MTPPAGQLALDFPEPLTTPQPRKTRRRAPMPLRAVPTVEPFTLDRATADARHALTAAGLLGSAAAVSRVVSWHSERRGWITTVALLRHAADPRVVAQTLAGLGEVKEPPSVTVGIPLPKGGGWKSRRRWPVCEH